MCQAKYLSSAVLHAFGDVDFIDDQQPFQFRHAEFQVCHVETARVGRHTHEVVAVVDCQVRPAFAVQSSIGL